MQNLSEGKRLSGRLQRGPVLRSQTAPSYSPGFAVTIGVELWYDGRLCNLAAGGLTPLTAEEHDAWARELAAREQARQLAEAMREHAKRPVARPWNRIDII